MRRAAALLLVPSAILMNPGDVALAGAGKALEMIALSSQSAPGIGRPDDPQLTIRWDAGGTERVEYAVFAHEGLPHPRIGASGSGAPFYRRVN